jgi:hypothetical protein
MKFLGLTLSDLLAASLLCTSMLQAEDEKKAVVSELRLGQGSKTGGCKKK